MNNEFLTQLRLNPKKIALDLNISSGLARAYLQSAEDSHEDEVRAVSIAATYFRRAGANALLLGRYSEAKALFFNATDAYQRLDMPYSVVVATLSSEGRSYTQRLAHKWLARNEERKIVERAIPQLAYVVIAELAFIESSQRSFDRVVNIRNSLDPYRLRPLGVLGISVGQLLDLFDSLIPNMERRRKRRIDLGEALSPLWNLYNTAIRQTLQNHYHWERLALPFHPADPDTYGMLILTNSALQIHRDVTIQGFIEQAEIAGESKYLLNTILDGMSGNEQNRNLLM